jgi:hypothetical protein
VASTIISAFIEIVLRPLPSGTEQKQYVGPSARWTRRRFSDFLGPDQREGQMLKILTLMAVATWLLVFNLTEPAMAQAGHQVTHQKGGFSGRCPVGTCANNGSEVAANVKNCKASNCSKSK